MLINKRNIKKALIMTLLLAAPLSMLLSFLIPTGKADTYIPVNSETDPNNNWHWAINGEDEFYYKIDMKITDNETQEIISRFRTLYILKDFSFENTTYDLYGITEVSIVNATQYFYNVSLGALQEVSSNSFPIAIFGYNSTNEPYERYLLPEGSIFPLLLPINNTFFEADIIANILNDTLHYASINGWINYFDDYSSNPAENNIFFRNTTAGYFINGTYYDNGVLEKGFAKFLNYDSDWERWMRLEFTIESVSNYNITDEIVWDVEIGDTLYYGSSISEDVEYGPYFNEFKMVIDHFDTSNYEIHTIWGSNLLVFENIWANISYWNESKGEYADLDSAIVAAANEFYPFVPDNIFENEKILGVIPNSTKKEDLEFMGEYYLSYPEIDDYNVDDNFVFELFVFSEGDIHFYNDFNNETGLLELRYVRTEGKLDEIAYSENQSYITGLTLLEPLFNKLVDDTQVFINATVLGTAELYSSVVPVNPLEPVGVPFYEEIPGVTVYIDVYSNESSSIINPNYTIYYNYDILDELEIPESKLKVYEFNVSGNSWDELDGANYTIDQYQHNIKVNVSDLLMLAIGTPEEWNWSSEIKIGSNLIYESSGILAGNVSELGNVTFPYIDFSILNITAIGEVNKIYNNELNTFNQINGTILYYDPTVDDLVTWIDDGPGTFLISEYNYNITRTTMPFLFNLTQYTLGYPVVIPLRWNQLTLRTIGFALNESFYSSSMARDMGLPIWNEIIINSLTNTLIFNDTSTDYCMKLTYYNNGTLKEAELAVKFTIDENDVDFNLTTTRMYDYNHTDEVDWGVEVGESYYMGSNFPNGGPTIEANITIVAINQTAVYLHDLIFSDDGDGDNGMGFFFHTWLTFENVWAKIEIWNITQEDGQQYGEWIELPEGNTITIIAAANNYFPFAPGNYYEYYHLSGFMIPVLLPIGIDGYDIVAEFSDYLTTIALVVFQGDVIPEIEDVNEEYLKINFVAPEEPEFIFYIEWYLNNNTGMTRFLYVYEESEGEPYITCIFTKNHSVGSGIDTYEFDNYLVPEIIGNLKIEASGKFDIFEALLHKNPVNNSIPSTWGTPMFYLDFFYINYTDDSSNMTFTLKLPSKYNVAYVQYVAIYIYDPEEPDVGVWERALLDDLEGVKISRDLINNIITVIVENINGSMVGFEAWFYTPPYIPPSEGDDGGGGAKKEAQPGIYSFDMWILLGIISFVSLILILKRQKIVEIF